ncbi:hypothetical protein XF24_00376 [candidate division SR1 bacterium Aalborg_AAW-1]|nr:hypothetical protein XF24_00376 [candidate division SR1 bacterium Aalborg_AAW-1]
MNYYIYEHENDVRNSELKQQIHQKLYHIVTEPTQADLIIVLGGDGTMLDAIHELHSYNIPFFGVNCGTLGFLLNAIRSPEEIPHHLEELEYITEPLLQATVTTKDDRVSTIQAINDFVIAKLDRKEWISMKLSKGDKEKAIQGSGLLITSAIGSTGTWANERGLMLPTGNNLIGIMGLSTGPFSTLVTKHDKDISISLESRRPIHLDIDTNRMTVENIKKVDIGLSPKTYQLAFLSKAGTSHFHNKRLELFTKKMAQDF